jgi:hypothetical protein
MKNADGGCNMLVTHYGMERGISIRDYFAAAALQGLIANGECPTWDDDAKAAYAAADAMLKAREAK